MAVVIESTDWSGAPFDLAPVARSTGPFVRREFLELMWWHQAPEEAEPWVVADDPAALIPLQRTPAGVSFIGDADLVDYRTPLGADVPRALEQALETLPRGTAISFDSLPEEAAAVLSKGLDAAGAEYVARIGAVSAVLDLPAAFDDYLASIGKKERHEVRRKRRRFVEVAGAAQLETHVGEVRAFDDFVRLHRSAAGAKGRFMDATMEALFRDLAALPGWRIDVLPGPGGRAAACAFGYADDDGYFLYNSAYDAELAEASPGIVLIGKLIEQCIMEGKRVFDFLKGDETYKLRLGARLRPLTTIGAVT